MAGDEVEIVLAVTRPSELREGGPQRLAFGRAGGRVGRGSACDLVLPDPSNLVSRTHFEVRFRDGRFEAVDRSGNGLFVNGGAEPVGEGRAARLHEGDRLGAGDYELKVESLRLGTGAGSAPGFERTFAGNPFGGREAVEPPPPPPLPEPPGPRAEPEAGRDPFGLPEGVARDPFAEQTAEEEDEDLLPPGGAAGGRGGGLAGLSSFRDPEDDPDRGSGPLIPEDYDPLADLSGDLAEPSLPGGAAPEAATPDHAQGWNVPISNVFGRSGAKPAPPAPESDDLGALIPDDLLGGDPAPTSTGEAEPLVTDPEPAREPERPPVSPAPPRAPAPPEVPSGGGAEVTMTAFWRAAGLSDRTTPALEAEEAGRLFGAMVRGLFACLRARTAFKEEFRAERTMLGSSGNNPLKFAVDAEQALESLVAPQARGFLAAERAVEEGFDDLRRHEMALVAAMHSALGNVLAEFDPEALSSRLEGMSLFDALPGGRRARYWDLYVKHYAEIASTAEDLFEGALGRAFVEAYEEVERKEREGR